MSKNKTTIVDALKTVLASGASGTQEEIIQALEHRGFETNQSKISRLLRKLGAVKTTNDRQQTVYRLPPEPALMQGRKLLTQLITRINRNENLIVIHTNPGSASFIGRILDQNRDELLILGTVAGDDTVFVAPKSVLRSKDTLEKIEKFLAELT